MRQGRGNLFVQRHTFGGIRKVRHLRVREPDRPNYLFGFTVPVDQRWQPALLLLWRYRVELQQQLHVEQQHSSSSTSSSSTSSSSTSSGGGSITGATCSSSGSQSITATIRVTSGTYDGGCKTFNPSGALGDGSQEEGQDPAFRVENGATLRNAILGNNGVDGVHFYNGGNLQNFRWTNVGEDAFTVKSSGTVNISGVSGYNGEDKFGQINAASTVNISNCIVDSMAKFIRQNGGTTFKITINADRCQISNMKEGVFRSDSSSSVARLTNSRLRSGSLCIGSWSSCTGSGNTNY